MLRIGKLTDYATVILATLAADRSRLQNAGSLAGTHPHRGAHRQQTAEAAAPRRPGEFHARHARRLPAGARDLKSISAAAILDALEGPIALTECSSGNGHCGIETQLLGRPHLAAAESSPSAARSARSRWRNSPASTTATPHDAHRARARAADAASKVPA